MNTQSILNKYNQQQLFRFKDMITKEQLALLKEQIGALNFDVLNELSVAKTKEKLNLSPIKTLTLSEINSNQDAYANLGNSALKNGDVAVVMLAGGMGTRLGSDLPKGMFNIGESKDLYIFECIFNDLIKLTQSIGKNIHLFIMTSPSNNAITQAFLKEHQYFGYSDKFVWFFEQEVNPCVDFNGKILLENEYTIATSPNGNGGWFSSLLSNGDCCKVLQDSHIKWLNLISVDNVLTKVADPVFVGACMQGKYQIGIKVIKKAYPEEKVGLVCCKNNRASIVEYMDLPKELAVKTDKNGELVYAYGAIINYLYDIDFLNEVKNNKLPTHVVAKKIPYINENGERVQPSEPNGYKFEYLNVDLVEFSSSCLPYEIDRQKEFAPIKNKTGVDSVDTAKGLLKQNGYVL